MLPLRAVLAAQLLALVDAQPPCGGPTCPCGDSFGSNRVDSRTLCRTDRAAANYRFGGMDLLASHDNSDCTYTKEHACLHYELTRPCNAMWYADNGLDDGLDGSANWPPPFGFKYQGDSSCTFTAEPVSDSYPRILACARLPVTGRKSSPKPLPCVAVGQGHHNSRQVSARRCCTLFPSGTHRLPVV